MDNKNNVTPEVIEVFETVRNVYSETFKKMIVDWRQQGYPKHRVEKLLYKAMLDCFEISNADLKKWY